ncbi:hypothetical protein IAD21_00719 [Abditibacteriota bacterium]|nr:hypothetical protein IAD21_00719 [Abditibacteriota bacterium]
MATAQAKEEKTTQQHALGVVVRESAEHVGPLLSLQRAYDSISHLLIKHINYAPHFMHIPPITLPSV